MNRVVYSIFLLLVIVRATSAQETVLLDFDSLYKNSKEFKEAFKEARPDGFFASDAPVIEMTLSSDFKQLRKGKSDSEYQEAIIQSIFADTIRITREVKIKARGAFRNSECFYPPLKVNFPKKKMKPFGMTEFDKVKLVRRCRAGDLYENLVLTEYLVYRMYNVVSENSLRVRLLRVKFIDEGKTKKNVTTSHAFFIEPIGQLAERKNCVEVTVLGISPSVFDSQEETLMSMFQYMVGNSDYSVRGLHNMKVMKSMDFDKPLPIAVPYDFDYTGLVNAPYAVPSELLPIEKVTDRIYLGACRSVSEYEQAIELLKSKKEELYEVVNSFDLLPKKVRNKHIKYLDSFYKEVRSRYVLKEKFAGTCKK